MIVRLAIAADAPAVAALHAASWRTARARLGGRETSEWEEGAPDGSRQMVWRVWWPDAGVLRP